LRLLTVSGGHVTFNGRDLASASAAEMRAYRSNLQVVFQDPYSSMNPRMMVSDIIREGMLAQHIGATREAQEARVDELLIQVGLEPSHKYRYPHEFSGGQRQRVCIARALAVDPDVIICDEPTSALDVSVQSQILDLLRELQQRLDLSYLFITHNLSVVAYIAHYVAVMYQGEIVEQGPIDEILDSPKHPYTQKLLAAIPTIGGQRVA
jgi:peptide/nickel transport system ATP-binding protein